MNESLRRGREREREKERERESESERGDVEPGERMDSDLLSNRRSRQRSQVL